MHYTILKDSLILVTGANGYIGSNVVNHLLDLGYRVRGTVRAEKPWLDGFFKEKFGPGRFETVVVPGLEDVEALREGMRGVHGVVHVASDLSWSSDPNAVIPKVVAATLNVLEAASSEESIKRVVLTSSSVTFAFPKIRGPDEGVVVDVDTWNDESIQQAWDPSTSEDIKPAAVYAASKIEAERAAWKWMDERKPRFGFNTVLPNMNWGRILHHEISGSSMGLTRRLLEGDDAIIKMLPMPQWFIDVEDDAKIHVIALLHPNVQSERLFACASPYNWTRVIDVLRKLRPGNDKIPNPPENDAVDSNVLKPVSRAEELLRGFYGKGWTSMEESLAVGIEVF